MYNYNVQPCHIRCLIILGGDTRQILNNLREEDNLRREDKSAVPKVSSLRRFHCTQSITTTVVLEGKYNIPLEIRVSAINCAGTSAEVTEEAFVGKLSYSVKR